MTRLFPALSLCLIGMAPAAFASVIEQVTINTNPLAGITGYLAFDLVGGIPLQGNTATISNFATTGTLGTSSKSGNVTGTLGAPPVILTANQFFNEYLQGFKFAAGTITFQLALTSNFAAGSTPDSFSFFLLNSSLAPYVTSDQSGADSLFSIDLISAPAPQVFTSAFATVTVVPVIAGVPEPATAALLAVCLGGLLGCRRRANR